MTPALVACYARDKVILGEIGMRPSEWIKIVSRSCLEKLAEPIAVQG